MIFFYVELLIRVFYGNICLHKISWTSMAKTSILTQVKTTISHVPTFLGKQVDKRPLISFFVFLFLLIGLAALGNKLRTPANTTVTSAPQVKEVETYQLSGAPSITVQAKIEKSGTITLVAQTAGVVQQIKKKEGDLVQRGTTVIALSTSYQGGNIASLSRQLAQKSFQFQKDTFDSQVDSINKQKDIAQKGNTVASELRSINRQSQDDTSRLITLNTDLLNSINSQLVTLSADNADHSKDATILQLQQSKVGVESGLSNLRSAQRTLEYQSADDKTPAQLADAQRDLALKQLDLQQKVLELNRDISGLNVQIARVGESLMYPASPCPGIVERVFVKIGQAVQPGTVLATIQAKDDQASAVALVSSQLAKGISRINPSIFQVDGQTFSVLPSYVSQEPTEGTLFSVIYRLPVTNAKQFSQGSWISVQIPLSYQVSHISASIPLDSVYQTQTESYVYVVGKNEQGSASAQVKKVQLGQVFGQYVEVKNGLSGQDQVIVDRTVLEGDLIQSK